MRKHLSGHMLRVTLKSASDTIQEIEKSDKGLWYIISP